MGVIINMSDKRRHERISINMECSLDIGGIHYTGVTGNVSRAGVYLQSLSPALQKERIAEAGELKLQMDGTSITSACRIVFIGGETTPGLHGVGLEFQGIQEEEVRRLEEFIRRQH